MLLDRVSLLKAKKLKIPLNILLLFWHANSSELNPKERLWEFIKAEIANGVYVTIEPLIDKLAYIVCSLSQTVIQSLTLYLYFINAFNEIFH